MKTKYILLFFILFACSSKTEEVTKDEYKKAIDYLNYTFIESSLKLRDEKILTEFQKKCTRGNSSSEDILQAISSEDIKLRGICNEFIQIKKSIDDISIAPEDAYKLLIRNIHDNTKCPHLSSFFEDFEISKDLELKIANLLHLTSIIPHEIKLLKSISKHTSIILGICIFLLIISFYKPTNIFKKTKKQLVDSNKVLLMDKIAKERFNATSEENQMLSNEIPFLKPEGLKIADKHTDEIKKQISGFNDIPLEISERISDELFNTPNIKETKTSNTDKIFFLSTPNDDGSFNESSVSFFFKPGASIYRFTKKSAKRASFRIESHEDAFRFALEYPEKNIYRVCDAENTKDSSSQKIKTISEGEAELSDSKWKVITKAKIRYES